MSCLFFTNDVATVIAALMTTRAKNITSVKRVCTLLYGGTQKPVS